MFYPGLLFWVLFPTALPVDNNPGLSSLDLWKGYYGDLSALGHAGVITFSRLFLYITWRYLLDEVYLALLGSVIRIGAAISFREKDDRGRNWYINSNGRLLWVRFGKRPEDANELEKAEDRFDNYMANRMAWVHSLGSTWFLFAVMGALGALNANSAMENLGGWRYLYWSLVIYAMVVWAWHRSIVARAEQFHYVAPTGTEE
jgi:hypothetical protein